MSGSHAVTMGDRGRLVVPQELRERLHLHAGSRLTLLETPDGIVLLTQEQLLEVARRDLEGLDLVAELLTERRRSAAAEDAESLG